MSNSLQDQLLNAGVANKKQAVKAKKAKNQKVKQRKSGVAVQDDSAKKLREEQAAKAERDRELNRQRDAKAAQKALAAQIVQIIEHSRVRRPEDSEIRFNFTDGTHVKYLHVTEEQRRHLAKGFLGIAKLGESYEIIPATAIEKIKSRDESSVVVWNKGVVEANADFADEDDPYAEYEIPDDLVW